MRNTEWHPKNLEGPDCGYRVFHDHFDEHAPPALEPQAMTAPVKLPQSMAHVQVTPFGCYSWHIYLLTSFGLHSFVQQTLEWIG